MSKLKIKNGSTWEEIPAGGVGVPSGGTAGQVLMKSSATDYADEWADISEAGAMSKWDLLWTNASPTSAFAAQTISLDLSGYDAVVVDVRAATDRDIHCWFLTPKGQETAMGFYVPTAASIFLRDATASQSGVAVGNGYWGVTNINNGCGLPYQIYGIKGVN